MEKCTARSQFSKKEYEQIVNNGLILYSLFK